MLSAMLRRSLLMLLLAFAGAGAFAQDRTAKEYEPQVGQDGKDVVWVPTPQALVDRMLDLAKVTPGDYVIDLGSGDGRTVITAAKRGARALGIEYNPNMVALSKRNAAREGVAERALFVRGDIFESDFSQATVITLFLLPELNIKLRPKILDMKPGTRVVSNSFTMGEWSSDGTVTASESEGCTAYCTAYLWIVPAKVAGKWQLAQGELSLKQEFQTVTGTLRSGDTLMRVVNGRLRGDQLTFTAGGAKYSARVEGETMTGTFVSPNGSGKWSASRAPRS
jgi:SAM-dependent methyltransferase